MTSPYLGEIRVFPYNFVPRGWELCDGRILDIKDYSALFSLIGNYYGGDGYTNFVLPDFRGRTLAGVGPGNGLDINFAEQMGDERETVAESALPAHQHYAFARIPSNNATLSHVPQEGYALSRLATNATTVAAAYTATGNKLLDPRAVTKTGTGEPHENMQPYLAMLICIATAGQFPPRPPE